MYELYSVLQSLIVCALACFESSLKAWIKYSELKARSIWPHCWSVEPLHTPTPHLLVVNLRLTLTHYQQTSICRSVSPAFSCKTNQPPQLPSPRVPGGGSSATTGLLVEVLREHREHCLNCSKTQLPSAPGSKTEDYQQPAVMRPRRLEIAGMARYTLPPNHNIVTRDCSGTPWETQQ